MTVAKVMTAIVPARQSEARLEWELSNVSAWNLLASLQEMT
jgi:hypothetical protein